MQIDQRWNPPSLSEQNNYFITLVLNIGGPNRIGVSRKREAGIFRDESNQETTDVVKSKNAWLQTHDIETMKIIAREECNKKMMKIEHALTRKFTVALKEMEEKIENKWICTSTVVHHHILNWNNLMQNIENFETLVNASSHNRYVNYS